MSDHVLVAVDVGNSRIKLGTFSGEVTPGLPEPRHQQILSSTKLDIAPLAAWLETWTSPDGGTRCHWAIGSVNRLAASALIDWLRDNRPADRVAMLSADDLSLRVVVPRPDRVGIDRLLDALAANRLRTADRSAVVVSVGSAITVDLVNSQGDYCGGAILPGIGMSARALHDFTDLLPEIAMHELTEPPPPLGIDTIAAMQAGLFWGAVGAIREIAARLSQEPTTELFLTGGASQSVATLLSPTAMCVPHLTLAGIALAYRRVMEDGDR